MPFKKNAAENQHICDGFAAFFSDKITKSASKIRYVILSGPLPPPVDVVHASPATFTQFKQISTYDFITAICTVPTKHLRWTFVPILVLKAYRDVFIPLTAELSAISFDEERFPDMLKFKSRS